MQPLCIGLMFLLLPLMVQLLDLHAFIIKINAFTEALETRPFGILLASVVYLLTGGVLISFGVPRLWISAGAGVIFNPWLGTAVALGASLLGAAVLFLVGWWFLSPGKWSFLEKRLGRYRQAFQQKAFLWVLYARLFPFSNSTVVSLFSGYCRVGLFPYLAGSLIGFTPLTIIMCLFGSGGTGGRTLHLILGFVLIILLHLFTLILKKWLPMAAPHCSPRRSDDGSC
ncbi:hypothetical protein JCM12294_44320 [Desulfocicer niacini]